MSGILGRSVVVDTEVWVVTVGEQGPTGPAGPAGPPGSGGGGGAGTEVSLSLADGTTSIFTTVAGKAVYRIAVIVTEAYDGASPTITVVAAGTNTVLVDSGDVSLAEVAVYEINPVYLPTVQESVNVVLDTGGSTTGKCVVVLYSQS